MKPSHLIPTLMLSLSVVALSACAPVSAPAAGEPTVVATTSTDEAVTPEAAEEATPADDTSSDATTVVPVDTAECERIQTAVAERLGVEFTSAEGDVANSNLSGTGCTLTATGTGEDFGNFVDTAQAIREVFVEDGWSENQNYLADGPTGTATGFEKENQVALVSVDWQPSAAVQCPADQPISACNVEPSEQIFTVIVTLAQAS